MDDGIPYIHRNVVFARFSEIDLRRLHLLFMLQEILLHGVDEHPPDDVLVVLPEGGLHPLLLCRVKVTVQ